MNYKLTKKYSGISKKDLILEFEEEFLIKDMIYYQDDIFFCIVGNSLSCIKNKKYIKNEYGKSDEEGEINLNKKKSRFMNPSSLCVSKDKKNLYICEKNGMSIRQINLNSESVKNIICGILEEHILKEFKKCAKYNGSTGITATQNNIIYWSSEVCNKIFGYKNSNLKTIMGTGRPGFSKATVLTNSMLNKPKSICFDGQNIYVTDSGNKYIREINNSSKEIFKSKTENILKIVCNNNKVYFIENNNIYLFNKIKNDLFLVHESSNLISIDIDKNNNIYILESL